MSGGNEAPACRPLLPPPTEPPHRRAPPHLQAVEQLGVCRIAAVAALLLRFTEAGEGRGSVELVWTVAITCPDLPTPLSSSLTTAVSAHARHDTRIASPTEAAKLIVLVEPWPSSLFPDTVHGRC